MWGGVRSFCAYLGSPSFQDVKYAQKLRTANLGWHFFVWIFLLNINFPGLGVNRWRELYFFRHQEFWFRTCCFHNVFFTCWSIMLSNTFYALYNLLLPSPGYCLPFGSIPSSIRPVFAENWAQPSIGQPARCGHERESSRLRVLQHMYWLIRGFAASRSCNNAVYNTLIFRLMRHQSIMDWQDDCSSLLMWLHSFQFLSTKNPHLNRHWPTVHGACQTSVIDASLF